MSAWMKHDPSHFSYQEELEIPREAYRVPGSNNETQERFRDGLDGNNIAFCRSHYYPN
jgi:hypothetical protein